MINNLHIESFGLCPGGSQTVAVTHCTMVDANGKLRKMKVEVEVIDWLRYLIEDWPDGIGPVLKWWNGRTKDDKHQLAAEYVQAHYTEEHFTTAYDYSIATNEVSTPAVILPPA